MAKVVGFDVGTGNLVSAISLGGDKVEVNSMRNMFLPIEPDMWKSSEIANAGVEYIEIMDEDGEEIESIAVLGEDAYRFGNIFKQEVRRPMAKGVISTQEIDALDVMSMMVEKMTGKSRGGRCVYSVPAAAIDVDIPPVLYHERVFNKIFSGLGYNCESLNEGLSIIYSECAAEKFSGIGISFGAGLTNVATAYKGTSTMEFAVSRGGDWIDQSVANSLGIIPTRITSIKEDSLDLMNPMMGNKKERRVREALIMYYTGLIEYVLKVIVKQFKESSDGLNINEKIPIIISGGTSKPDGFIDLFKTVFSEFKNFPYEISEIRSAKNPLTAVANGCLIYGMWKDSKETQKNKEENK